MNRYPGILLFCLACLQPVSGNDLYQLVEEGNRLYMEDAFELAVEKYEAVIDSGYSSPELYFNLGNAYYKSHRITMALVNYERARIIDPDDEEIARNLAIAKEFVVDRIEVLPEVFYKKWYRKLVKSLDSDVWAIISMCSFVIALLLLLVYFFSHKLFLQRITFWVAVVLLFASLSGFVFAAQQKKLVTQHHLAIIRTPSVTIESSPDEASGTDLFLLHEGTMVEIVDRLGEWREVRLSDGNQGWLKITDLIEL